MAVAQTDMTQAPHAKTTRTASAYVAQHLKEIEYKITMGVFHGSILEDMAADGQRMTLTAFRKALMRARARVKQDMQNGRQRPSPAKPPKLTGKRLSAQELQALEQQSM